MAFKKATSAVIRLNRTPPTPGPLSPAPKKTLPLADLTKRYEWKYIAIGKIKPYANNARDNDKAIPAVMESIRHNGFIVPIVLDAKNVLVAGHTRYEAAKRLNMVELPYLNAAHLSADQIKAFRLMDNKVAEIATWNHDKLAVELNSIMHVGYDFTSFGFDAGYISSLSDTVGLDALNPTVTAPVVPQQRRAPQTVRLVLGEFVMFVPINAYRVWIDGQRALHDFNEDAIAADIRRRLGILD